MTKWKSLHGKAEIKTKRCAVRFVLNTCDFVHAHADLCAYNMIQAQREQGTQYACCFCVVASVASNDACAPMCEAATRLLHLLRCRQLSVQCNYVNTCLLVGVFICAVTSLKFITSL